MHWKLKVQAGDARCSGCNCAGGENSILLLSQGTAMGEKTVSHGAGNDDIIAKTAKTQPKIDS